MLELLRQPWPWYVAGPIIGLMVPALFVAGNRLLGISGNLRHMCAAVLPARVKFLHYDWRAEAWNLYFALGLILGGWLGYRVLGHPEVIRLSVATIRDLRQLGVTDLHGLLPRQLFALSGPNAGTGWALMLIGGFLVGFGTRYAGGCTSGHGIAGLSTLQWPSLVAVIAFFIGGVLTTHFLFPLIF
jgi:uncharacterized membrane protein YedE/YeeE